MLDNKIVEKKLNELFGVNIVSQEAIHSSEKTVITLVETNEDYALVSVKDFTDQPIGDVDLFVEVRIKKSGSTLKDMAEMVSFLKKESDYYVQQIQEKIEEYSNGLNDYSKTLGKNSIFSC